MEQTIPQPQNTFLATALERKLLFLVSKSGTLTAQEIVSGFPAEQSAAVLNALDGCRAKRFVAQDAAGRLILTADGQKQL